MSATKKKASTNKKGAAAKEKASPRAHAPAKKSATKKGAAKKGASAFTYGAPTKSPAELMPVVAFATTDAWTAWLDTHHASSRGVWMKIAKKGSDEHSITYAEALEIALAYGWIDGQKGAHDDAWWLQKFTPRGAKSIWSTINRAKALALIEAGKMTKAGLAEVERAQKDGRWARAYEPQSKATVPADLAAALAASPRAKAFFATLESRNRYAVLWRVSTAKTEATRGKWIAKLVAMLARHEKIHP